ncbi:hypothetical protein LTR36_002964 [Oleoguttula mirabilis]|uniref:Uncharacterized protein n=1 Tax=Oleoguttula mirabilis TaxID=1507867 RepID=A0AAV9JW64_9PEZI|nr:hypothetical protein LTR36_002964 [Oleoguttula mirabilis]
MALITTFATTPITSALYPAAYQRKLEAWKRGDIDWDTGAPIRDGSVCFDDGSIRKKLASTRIESLLIYLRLDNMPNTLAFVSLFGGRPSTSAVKTHPQRDEKEYGRDPVSTKEQRKPIVSGEVAVVPEDSFAESLTVRASDEQSDLLLLPWTETGSLSESPMVSKNTIERKLRSDAYSRFVAEALNTSPTNTAVFINKGFGGSLEQSPAALTRRIIAKSGRGTQRDLITELPSVDRSHHIFMPFFGGPDGQAALRLVLQLADNPEITATMVHYQIKGEDVVSEHVTLKGVPDGKIRVSTSGDETDEQFFVTLQRTLPEDLRSRLTFRTIISYDPVQDAVANAQAEVGQKPGNGGDIIMVGRNIDMVETQGSSCLGLVADVMLERDVKASMVVIQARKEQISQVTMR